MIYDDETHTQAAADGDKDETTVRSRSHIYKDFMIKPERDREIEIPLSLSLYISRYSVYLWEI